MAVLDARQVFGQGLASGALALGLVGWRRGWRLLGQFGSGGGHIRCQGFLKEVALLGGECFAAGAKAHPAQMGQFQDECLDLGLGCVEFGVASVELGVAGGKLFDQACRFGSGLFLSLMEAFLNGVSDSLREGGIEVETSHFSEQIHA